MWKTQSCISSDLKIDLTSMRDLSPAEFQLWDCLQRSDRELENPFFRPEYAALVTKHDPGAEVAVLRQGGDAVGFFPFHRDPGSAGHPLGGMLADMHGVIGRPDLAYDPLAILKACQLTSWTFDHLPTSQKPFQPYHGYLDESPIIDLTDGFEAYQNQRRARGSSIVKDAARRKRRLESDAGPLRFEWIVDDEDLLVESFRWKREQLRAYGYDDMYACPQIMSVVQEICRQRTPSFTGMLSAIFAGRHVISVMIGVQSYHTYSAWIPIYNPLFARYSPGLILHVELARLAAQRGISRIHLGRGENQLKNRLMTCSTPVAIGAIEPRLLPSLARQAWYRVRQVVHGSPLRHGPLRLYRRLRNRWHRPSTRV